MPPELKSVRERLLAFPSRLEGLDAHKIESFLASRKLNHTNYVVHYSEDIPEIESILGHNYIDEPSIGGIFIPELDIVLVLRDKELEENNGTAFTEGKIIHELAHSAKPQPLDYTEFPNNRLLGLLPGISLKTPSSGFLEGLDTENSSGWFIEEGFADLMRGEYIALNMPNEVKKAIINSDTELLGLGERRAQVVKYAYLDHNDEVKIMNSSHAALAIELLCEKEPLLREELLNGRNDLSVGERIKNYVNRLSPGLYDKLNQLDYTSGDFVEGLRMVVKEVYLKSETDGELQT